MANPTMGNPLATKEDDAMTQIMSAPGMTDGQIENAINKLRDAMRKHRSEISSDTAQQVLGVENLGMIMFAPFRKYAEEFSNRIICIVKVNRGRSLREAIEVIGHVHANHANRDLVDSMPKGKESEQSDDVEVVFFKPDLSDSYGVISDNDLAKEFALRGLKPADLASLVAVNEADQSFVDARPHGTYWKDAEGRQCFATFERWDDHEVRVFLGRNTTDWWSDQWWFAGLRK